MNRRDFLKIVGITTAHLLLPSMDVVLRKEAVKAVKYWAPFRRIK